MFSALPFCTFFRPALLHLFPPCLFAPFSALPFSTLPNVSKSKTNSLAPVITTKSPVTQVGAILTNIPVFQRLLPIATTNYHKITANYYQIKAKSQVLGCCRKSWLQTILRSQKVHLGDPLRLRMDQPSRYEYRNLCNTLFFYKNPNFGLRLSVLRKKSKWSSRCSYLFLQFFLGLRQFVLKRPNIY